MSSQYKGPGTCTKPDGKPECPKKGKGSGSSDNPIRLYSGRILLDETDIDINVPGFGHTRSFLNINYELVDWEGPQGWNWAIGEWPYLMQRINSFGIESLVLKNGMFPLWFDVSETTGAITARYGENDTNFLEAIPTEGILRYTRVEDGAVAEIIDFHDFDQPDTDAGMMKRRVDESGFETVVTSAGDKRINILETTRGTKTFRMTYNYYSSGIWNGKVESVEADVTESSVTTPLRRCRYDYYDGTTAEGLTGDLKAAITQQPVAGSSPTTWEDISVRYYRYEGGRHLVTAVVGPTVYMLLKRDGQDVLTMTQSSSGQDLVPAYANHLFEYDEAKRCSREVARGTENSTGPDGLRYTRVRNENQKRNQKTPGSATGNNSTGYNYWYWKVTETGRDGIDTITYTNKIGQPIAVVKQDTKDRSREWIDIYLRSPKGRGILHAHPSAVIKIDESRLDLIGINGDGTYANLRPDSGLIEETSYYSTTTATDQVAGGVEGYLHTTSLREGYNGSLIPQSEYTYIASPNSSGPQVYAVAEETTFKDPVDTPASRITLNHAYSWYTGGTLDRPSIREKITTYPVIPIDEGGDGNASTTKYLFDNNGNMTYEMDERGIMTKYDYDLSRGLLIREFRDTDDYPGFPGWTPTPGNHFNQRIDYEYDDLGRRTRMLEAAAESIISGAAENVRSMTDTLHLDMPLSGQLLFQPIVLNQIRSTGGYRRVSDSSEEIIDPVTIEFYDKCGRVIQRVESKRTTGSGALAESDTFLRSDWSRWTTFFFNERGMPAGERLYSAIPAATTGLDGIWNDTGAADTNYDQSSLAYASTRSLRIRRVGLEGTVTRMLYDTLGQLTNTFTGTDDSGSDGTWESWTANSDVNSLQENMVQVETRQYDSGLSGGDSYLTRRDQWLSDELSRVMQYVVDFRGRTLVEEGEEGWLQAFQYDNLDRLLFTRQYNTTLDGPLVAQSESRYNDRDWIYASLIYDVDPDSGAVNGSMEGQSQYDPAGNLTETYEPGDGTRRIWTEYDNLGRINHQKLGYWDEGQSPAVAIIVESIENEYDTASHLIGTITSRLNTGSSTSGPTYRLSYTQHWLDALNRQISLADLGALSAAPTRPATPPASTDDVLVTTTNYNDRGENSSTVDPSGTENQMSYDNRGRMVENVDHYVAPGNPSEPTTGDNRTRRYTYTPDSQLAELIIVFPAGATQTTSYVYGSSLVSSDIASNTLLAEKVYDDGSAERYSYNRQSELASHTDPNLTTHDYHYDLRGRQIHDVATIRSPQIIGDVRCISNVYDLRNLVTHIRSSASADLADLQTVNEVQRVYDGYGQLVKEFQEHTGHVVYSNTPMNWSSREIQFPRSAGQDNSNLTTGIVYPSAYGLDYVRDSIERVNTINVTGGSLLADYNYLGANIPVYMEYSEIGLTLDIWEGTAGVYPGLDRFNRIIDQKWRFIGNDRARLEYGYSRDSLRNYRRDAVAASQSQAFDELYSYDGVNQLSSLQRGTLNTARTALDAGTETFNEYFSYDSIGNITNYQTGDPNETLNQNRSYNDLNQISRLSKPELQPFWTKPRFDDAGNTTRIPLDGTPDQALRVDYDAWNRPVWVYTYDVNWNRKKVACYTYDGRGYRITEQQYDPAGSPTGLFQKRFDYYYDNQWRLIETYESSSPHVSNPTLAGNLNQRYLWNQAEGLYPDSLILRDRDTGSGISSERLYACQDAHMNVVALVDTSGNVQERMSYTAFGTPEFWDASYNTRTESSYDWNVLFSGYLLNKNTGLYNVRYRSYAPVIERWMTRDPIGEEGGLNLYTFVENDPTKTFDHDGLKKKECCSATWEGLLKYHFGVFGASLVHTVDVLFICTCQKELRSNNLVKIGATGYKVGRIDGTANLTVKEAKFSSDLKGKNGQFYHADVNVGVSVVQGPGGKINSTSIMSAETTGPGVDVDDPTDIKPGGNFGFVMVTWKIR
ncbi:MAG: RHS repeat-associated core domain-containing protein [Verrucomicrobiota bacterium]